LLLDVFGGNDTLARAVSRLLVLGFYLLSLGFVTLTMRTGGDIASARAGLQLLLVKIGEVLLWSASLMLWRRPPTAARPTSAGGSSGSPRGRPPSAAHLTEHGDHLFGHDR